jgi:hypothetical protein
MSATTTTRRTGGSTTQLNQIIAIEEGTKTRAARVFTDAYHQLQRHAQLTGITKTYQPSAEDGEQLPGESTRVQVRADLVTSEVALVLARMFDVMITKDTANTQAKADVIVNGQVLIPQAPVTFLLTLEKKLVDLRTYLVKLPVLDVAELWAYDPNAEAYATAPVRTTRTKKIPRNHVKAPATDKHPAQVEIYTEDIVVGHWSTTKFSGAVPSHRRTELVERVEALLDAVKFAREAANSIAITDVSVGGAIFDYLLA